MATIPETKNETSPQKSAVEAKNDNATCTAEKCELKQEKNEGRESAENLKNQCKDAAGDKKLAVNSSAETSPEDAKDDQDSAQEDDGAELHQGAEKNGEQKSSSPKKEAHKKPLDQSNDDSADDDDQDEEAGEPESKKRRTLPSEETKDLAEKGKIGVNDNGPEEVEELKNGSSKN